MLFTLPPSLDMDKTISQLTHIKAVLLFASTMTVMSGAIIAPALPGISRHFPDQPQVVIQLILTLPALMITLFSPLMGYLADRFGRKKLLLMMLGIYGFAGVAGFFIDRVDLLLSSRALMGIAVAGILSISTTLVGDYFDGAERARFLGLQSSCMALGGVIFINLGGLLSDWSWRGPFLLYMTGVLLLPYAWAILQEPQSSDDASRDTSDVPVTVDYGRTGLAYLIAMISMTMFYMFPAQLPFLLSQQGQVSGVAIGVALSMAALLWLLQAVPVGDDHLCARFFPGGRRFFGGGLHPELRHGHRGCGDLRLWPWRLYAQYHHVADADHASTGARPGVWRFYLDLLFRPVCLPGSGRPGDDLAGVAA
jgi:MFS family permease